MRQLMGLWLILLMGGLALAKVEYALPDKGQLVMDSPLEATFQFGGETGRRLEASREQWLLPVPYSNPGIVEMIRLRGREPQLPLPVPWSGEYIGKFLLGAIEQWQLTGNAELKAIIQLLVNKVAEYQKPDGYAGPWPEETQLIAQWDLWGHYHLMMALLTWYELTGDEQALTVSKRMGDLIARTYVEKGFSTLEAPPIEMNMNIIHSLGWLYRLTGEARYLAQMRQIEADWEKSGDFLRNGLAHVPYFMGKVTRWESLHGVDGLVEFYRITGDERYAEAFSNLWDSMRLFDTHTTGGFSTGESAIGDQFAMGSIETCCVIAFNSLSIDELRVKGNSLAGDALEQAFWNAVLGFQHPTCRWFTYDTPMDGRQISAYTVMTGGHGGAGTSEFGCCPANGARGLGMLAKWAVMESAEGPVINYYGPLAVTMPLAEGGKVALRQVTDYPVSPVVRLEVTPDAPREFALRLRIPKWSADTAVRVNGAPVQAIEPGTFLTINRHWKAGDVVEVRFDFTPRAMSGDGPWLGKVALFRGPLLLAWAQGLSDFDAKDLPALDLARPWSLEPVEVKNDWYKPVAAFRLVQQGLPREPLLTDFATAGALGTEYLSWLPAEHGGPPPFNLVKPFEGQAAPEGLARFNWTRSSSDKTRTFALVIAEDEAMTKPVLTGEFTGSGAIVDLEPLQPNTRYWWNVTSTNQYGKRESENGPYSFIVDPSLPVEVIETYQFSPEGIGAASKLAGNSEPTYGKLLSVEGVKPAEGPSGQPDTALEFNGAGRVMYSVPWVPDDYSFSVWVMPLDVTTEKTQQLVSFWCAGMDDPLRVYISAGQLAAAIEGGGGFHTPKAPVQANHWYHVVAVKSGTQLSLYLDGKQVAQTGVRGPVMTRAQDFSLGANPHYAGDEYLIGRLADFVWYGKALTDEEIAELAARKP